MANAKYEFITAEEANAYVAGITAVNDAAICAHAHGTLVIVEDEDDDEVCEDPNNTDSYHSVDCSCSAIPYGRAELAADASPTPAAVGEHDTAMGFASTAEAKCWADGVRTAIEWHKRGAIVRDLQVLDFGVRFKLVDIFKQDGAPAGEPASAPVIADADAESHAESHAERTKRFTKGATAIEEMLPRELLGRLAHLTQCRDELNDYDGSESGEEDPDMTELSANYAEAQFEFVGELLKLANGTPTTTGGFLKAREEALTELGELRKDFESVEHLTKRGVLFTDGTTPAMRERLESLAAELARPVLEFEGPDGWTKVVIRDDRDGLGVNVLVGNATNPHRWGDSVLVPVVLELIDRLPFGGAR